MTTMYGIANCDTIKKAKRWLDQHNIEYQFHDYKKHGVDTVALANTIETFGLEKVVNKRGTTYRKLSDEQKQSITGDAALDLLCEHSSMIKRPILVSGDKTLLGFSEDNYKELFGVE